MLNGAEEVLLRPDDRPPPHDPQPAHHRASEPARPHHVEREERASAPQPRQAVHRPHARRRVHDLEEGGHHLARRLSAVLEEELVVADVCGGEDAGVVLGRVEPHHVRHAQVYKHLRKMLRAEAPAPQQRIVDILGAAQVLGSAERNELQRHHLHQVGLKGIVVVLVLLHVRLAPERAPWARWAADPASLLAGARRCSPLQQSRSVSPKSEGWLVASQKSPRAGPYRSTRNARPPANDADDAQMFDAENIYSRGPFYISEAADGPEQQIISANDIKFRVMLD